MHKLPLGWVIIGEACIGNIHKSDYINVNKACLLDGVRQSLLTPCHNAMHVSQRKDIVPTSGHTIPRLELCAAVIAVEIAHTVAEHIEMPIETFTFNTDIYILISLFELRYRC